MVCFKHHGMINEHKFHSRLGVGAGYLRVVRYFDNVWRLLLVPQAVSDAEQWVENQVKALQTSCYAASLRLIQNSLGCEAEMLSCMTSVRHGRLLCVHKSKNSKCLQKGLLPWFACFLPFTTAHARRRTVLSNSLVGLFDRMFMDTHGRDIPLLLPVLLSCGLRVGGHM
jgi:hypothetical protein